jgi:hypothetical protein
MGKLLTVKESFQLNLVASTDRQRAIELIAEHLDAASHAVGRRHQTAGNAPRDWYGRRRKGRSSRYL